MRPTQTRLIPRLSITKELVKAVITRRAFLGIIGAGAAWVATSAFALQGGGDGRKNGGRRRRRDDYALPANLTEFAALSLVLGRPTDKSVTVSVLAKDPLEGYLEYGTESGRYAHKTGVIAWPAGEPTEVVLDGLQPNTPYFYQACYRKADASAFESRPECRFHTQRTAGSTFAFGVQGDSHPERDQMNDPELYARTLLDAERGHPDFYVCMGDDFSVDTLQTVDAESVAARYTLQRPFLGLVAQSAALFLVNGNHEQASLFNFNQTDGRHDVAVWAQNARNRYFPTVAPDHFYSGDVEPVKSIGMLKDYYAWTWGDALFVVLDNYWHSAALVDSGFQEKRGAGQGHKNRDWWGITIGDAQYAWLERTLEQSKAKYKFVFAHHVMGTGRGGVEEATLYEWGGDDKRGDRQFGDRRPLWDMPIHRLMVKHGVTIFFQGHDHLFARQEMDGVVYQEVPMPADQGYVAYNEDRYWSGDKLPNSGHLRVTVAPEQVKVDYVRCYLPKDETETRRSGEIAHSYTVKARPAVV